LGLDLGYLDSCNLVPMLLQFSVLIDKLLSESSQLCLHDQEWVVLLLLCHGVERVWGRAPMSGFGVSSEVEVAQLSSESVLSG